MATASFDQPMLFNLANRSLSSFPGAQFRYYVHADASTCLKTDRRVVAALVLQLAYTCIRGPQASCGALSSCSVPGQNKVSTCIAMSQGRCSPSRCVHACSCPKKALWPTRRFTGQSFLSTFAAVMTLPWPGPEAGASFSESTRVTPFGRFAFTLCLRLPSGRARRPSSAEMTNTKGTSALNACLRSQKTAQKQDKY